MDWISRRQRAWRNHSKGWRTLASALALVLLGLASSATAADPEIEAKLTEAREAIAAEDYARARKILTPLAKSDNPNAQVGLGSLYAAGLGLERDDEAAASWYARAAKQGHAIGQYNFGVCRLQGRGTEMNRVEALMWVSLSASQGFLPAQQLHPAIAESLDKDDREEGKRRAREWKPE